MTVLKKSFKALPFNIDEILRYAGCSDKDESVMSLLDECIEEAKNAFSYEVCYCELPIKINDGVLDLTFQKVKSEALLKNLKDCDRIILFGATVGIKIDRLILKYSHISPAKAVMFQAIGAERIESLCESFCDYIKDEYKAYITRPRFSPGYGDLSLCTQREIFKTLDCYRNIGVSLNESMSMSPSKSVTAIIGIKSRR